jgi:hypothetical protein
MLSPGRRAPCNAPPQRQSQRGVRASSQDMARKADSGCFLDCIASPPRALAGGLPGGARRAEFLHQECYGLLVRSIWSFACARRVTPLAAWAVGVRHAPTVARSVAGYARPGPFGGNLPQAWGPFPPQLRCAYPGQARWASPPGPPRARSVARQLQCTAPRGGLLDSNRHGNRHP